MHFGRGTVRRCREVMHKKQQQKTVAAVQSINFYFFFFQAALQESAAIPDTRRDELSGELLAFKTFNSTRCRQQRLMCMKLHRLSLLILIIRMFFCPGTSVRAKTTTSFINLESPCRRQINIHGRILQICLCVPHFSSCTTFCRQTGLFVRRESSLLSSFAPPITGICVIIPRCCNSSLISGRAPLNHDKLSCSPR